MVPALEVYLMLKMSHSPFSRTPNLKQALSLANSPSENMEDMQLSEADFRKADLLVASIVEIFNCKHLVCI